MIVHDLFWAGLSKAKPETQTPRASAARHQGFQKKKKQRQIKSRKMTRSAYCTGDVRDKKKGKKEKIKQGQKKNKRSKKII